MAKLSKVKADLQAEKEGIWVTFALDIEFLIGRGATPEYNRYLRKISAPYRSRLQGDGADKELLRDLVNKATARYIFLGWKNVEDDDGNVIPYSEEKAYEILSDPEYHDVRDFVLEVSQSAELYRQHTEEEAKGN